MKHNRTTPWCAPRKLRFDVEVELTAPPPAAGEFIPAELPDVSLQPSRKAAIAPASFWVVGTTATGAPLVFDAQATGNERFRIPCRFDPDYAGNALPLAPRRGNLVFLARRAPRRQRFSIYFDPPSKTRVVPPYGGLIGDGDVFTQKRGQMAVAGSARPVLWGEQLCGRHGLVVAASVHMGVHYFEDIGGAVREPVFVNRGRLRDIQGRLITGIPTFHDMTGNGLLDLVVGREDGTLAWHRNVGTPANPRFAPAVPLAATDGVPLTIKPFLIGQYITVKDKRGRLNRHYPRMPLVLLHGGRCRLSAAPLFAPSRNPNACDLIVGTRGGFLVCFRQTKAGFDLGRLLKDTSGKPLRMDGPICFPTCSPDSRSGRVILWVGDYYGRVFRLVQAGTEDGLPVFHPPQRVNIPDNVEYSFPLAVKSGRGLDLWMGDFHGHVKRYHQVGRTPAGDPEFDAGRPVLMDNAWIVHHMPVAHYKDLNGDGMQDIVSGDVKGSVYGYRNLGTNANPVFDAGRLLKAGGAPLVIRGGPDPLSPSDGYSKPIAADLSGSGHPDLLVGTGLGRVMHFAWKGLDPDSLPRFRRGAVLRDTRGNPVRCHHMSGLEVADWDGDGVPDLIVGGQRGVHASPDDDLDFSQVRFYKGVRTEKRLRFRPYVPLNAEGDNVFCNRPVALAVTTEAGQRNLIVNRMCFRQFDARRPERVEFTRFLPSLVIRAREPCPNAYGTLSILGPRDPLIVEGSVVGSLFAFRQSFVTQGDYLAVRFRVTRPYTRETLVLPAPGRWARRPSLRVQKPIKHQTAGFLPLRRVADSARWNRTFTRGQAHWPATPLHCGDAWMMPAPDRVEVRAAGNREALFLLVEVTEPLMDRVIAWVDHNNGPLESDDRVEVRFDPTGRGRYVYFGMINHKGFFKEMNIRRDTGQAEGPWRVGARPIRVLAMPRKDGFGLAIAIPWVKWNLSWKAAADCRLEIKRRRHLYANEVRAREQRLSSVSSLSGKEWGWLRLKWEGKE